MFPKKNKTNKSETKSIRHTVPISTPIPITLNIRST